MGNIGQRAMVVFRLNKKRVTTSFIASEIGLGKNNYWLLMNILDEMVHKGEIVKETVCHWNENSPEYIHIWGLISG